MTQTLIDTGPLVAYLDASERLHPWVVEHWRALAPPLITCEAVVTEAVFLLCSARADLDAFWELFRRELVHIGFELETELEPVAELMRRYQSVPMDLADACLVRMSELRKDVRVFTLDSDFKLYRRHGRQTIPLLYPE